MSFQTQVNLQQAPAVAGDFASNNPHIAKLSGENPLIAGEGGVKVGIFAWINNGVVSNSGTGKPHGFVGRANQALTTEWLEDSSMIIPEGAPVILYVEGDFWASSIMPALSGWSVFASTLTGEIFVYPEGSTPPSDYIATNFIVGDAPYIGTFPNELIKITTWGV